MATTIEQQVALDEALIPSTKRLRIGRSNFRLPSDIQSKEPTLQVVYDVLRECPFFKAFLEARIHEEEEADKLYRDVNINQGRRIQVSQDIKDSHVTLTLVQPDGQQESTSVSSFVTSMLNPISDAGVESIFTTASSSVAPLPTPIPTMTPSIITTITTASHPPIPPTPIPTSFSEYRQTNPFAEAVSNILGEQRNLYKALVDAYEADKTILESYGDTAILKRRREDDDDQEGPSARSDRGSKRRREGREPESASTPSKPATRSASSDGTLNDVRNALDDRLKGIRMQYLPQTNWGKGDKDRAAAMIQAIDKMLKTRRIMRSLERFIGG
nr:hypothetical protein [Tanacetum cinerariifolium]